jgi:hypothetical protein
MKPTTTWTTKTIEPPAGWCFLSLGEKGSRP